LWSKPQDWDGNAGEAAQSLGLGLDASWHKSLGLLSELDAKSLMELIINQ
jgi:hypothetical protein